MIVGVIGAGAWGTALSIVSARGGADVVFIHGHVGGHIIKQSRRRINIERSPDNDEDIRLFGISDSGFNHRHRFAKPNDERTKLGAVTCQIAHFHFPFLRFQCLNVFRIVRFPAGSDLGQFSV